MSRAIRRHHKFRMRQRCERIARREWCYIREQLIKDNARKLADNMKFCRHVGCANCRRLYGPTWQEKISQNRIQEYMNGL